MFWVSALLILALFAPPAQAAEDPTTDRVLLLVDTSGSMEGDRLQEARTAIQDIVTALDPAIPFGIGTFAGEERILVPPTTDRAAVLEAARGLRANGDTALRDSLIQGLGIPDVTRIVVVSDGADTASTASLDQVLAAIDDTPTPISVIAIDPSQRQRQTLERIAAASGGGVITAPEAFADSLTAVTVATEQAIPTATPDSTPTPAIDAAPAPEPVLSASSSVTAGMLAALTLLGVVAILIAGWRTVEVVRRRTGVRRVIEYYTTPEAITGTTPRTGLGVLVPDAWEQRIRTQLEGAQIPLGATAWLILQSTVMLLIFAAILAVGLPLPLAILGLGLGWLITELVLRSRIQANRRHFEGELADFLTLVASGLRSGLSLAQAVASGAHNGSDVLAQQMRRATAEVALGVDLPDALEHVAARMESEDLHWAVQALRIQRESGGSLSGILDTAATAVRQRAQVQREVRSLSAEGRLSAVILLILPISVFAFFFVTRRDYIEIFWTQPIGWVLLTILVGILGIGAVWMKRITTIDV